jgi:ComF family protein
VNGILEAVSDVLFPPTCVSCSAVIFTGDRPFCPSCFEEIDFISSPLCSCCGMPFGHEGTMDHLCGECITGRPPFLTARAVGRYRATLLEAIHRFKYNRETALGQMLGRMMAAYPFPGFEPGDYSLIIPVPLHEKKLRERGFNQSVVLARELSRCYALPLDFMSLRRLRHTEPQVGLGGKERETNVRGAFTVKDSKSVKGAGIILVDDVFTTGSTLRECARCLMDAGAERVAVLTLARAI